MENMEISRKNMTREEAHALMERLFADSLATRQAMEETFHTDPGIQTALTRLACREQTLATGKEKA